jgi:hypothetical protein
MKQSSFVTKLAMFLLFAGVICYFAASAWQSLFNPFSTVLAYSDTVDDSIEATGYLVRKETALPSGAGIVDIIPAEGERLGVGQTVAVLYRDEAALERKQTIKGLELDLEQLEYSLKQEGDTAEAGKVDEEIYGAMEALRSASVNQSYSAVDDQTLLLKSLVFRREYTRSAGAASDVSALITSLTSQISSLEAASAQDTTEIAVDRSGIFSSYVDGYESIFTPDAMQDLTVSGLTALEAAQPAAESDALGRLVTGSRWYFAALLSQEDAARLTEQEVLTVAFSRDFSGEIPMRVESLSAGENGRVAAVLSTSRGLSDTLLLRKQAVELVFASYAGVRVPKKTLRVLSDGTTGVYVVSGVTAEFKKADILAEGEDFYLLASADETDPGHILRAGDEVILAAKELYDGKVVR